MTLSFSYTKTTTDTSPLPGIEFSLTYSRNVSNSNYDATLTNIPGNPNQPSKVKQIMAYIMIAYEYYWVDKRGETHSFAILPERRGNPERFTEKSIMKWGRMVIIDRQ